MTLGEPTSKIDVEGWEIGVLRGANKWCFTQKPVLFVEFNDKALRDSSRSLELLRGELLAKKYSSAHCVDKQGCSLSNGRLEDDCGFWSIVEYPCTRGAFFKYVDICAVIRRTRTSFANSWPPGPLAGCLLPEVHDVLRPEPWLNKVKI